MSGEAVEEHVREIAALLGIADFVYTPTVVRKGTATREVSDGLLLCSQGVVVLQVKARETTAAARDDPEAARRWLNREFESAVQQGYGTRRTVRSRQVAGDPVRATSVRALDFAVDRRDEFGVVLKDDPTGWPIVVVLDHPKSLDICVTVPDGVFVCTLDDWHQLNHAIRSVSGVVRYIQRVLEVQAAGPFRLGQERDRFAAFARADAEFAAEKATSVPWFTLDGTHEDLGVELYRELLERVWLGDARGPALSAEECRLILDFLDDVPVATQAAVGRWIVEKRDRLRATGNRQSGVHVLDDRPLLYACTTEANEPDPDGWKAELCALTAVRLEEWREQRGCETPAVCVGVRAMSEGIEYTHIYMASEDGVQVPAEIRADIEHRFGVPNLTAS
jgi:hypothetical protein